MEIIPVLKPISEGNVSSPVCTILLRILKQQRIQKKKIKNKYINDYIACYWNIE